jgi:hypothetical protein
MYVCDVYTDAQVCDRDVVVMTVWNAVYLYVCMYIRYMCASSFSRYICIYYVYKYVRMFIEHTGKQTMQYTSL